MTFCRMIVEEAGSLGGYTFSGWPIPEGWREETDAELRVRIMAALDSESDDEPPPPCTCSTLGCGVHACQGECGCVYCHNAYQDFLSDDMD